MTNGCRRTPRKCLTEKGNSAVRKGASAPRHFLQQRGRKRRSSGWWKRVEQVVLDLAKAVSVLFVLAAGVHFGLLQPEHIRGLLPAAVCIVHPGASVCR
jgi:hypothetical protein